jgi:hypothetical protein
VLRERPRIDGRHLIDWSNDPKGQRKAAAKSALSYSRVELTAPSVRAIAELELPSGAKLRLHSQAPEILMLVSSLCELRGAR